MAEKPKTPTKAAQTSEKTSYRVREHLVVKLTKDKIFKSGELIELTPEQYKEHQLRVETIDQYNSRVNPVEQPAK